MLHVNQHIPQRQQPNQIIIGVLAGALFLSVGLLIGPIRFVLARIHNETLIYQRWCEMVEGEGLARMRLVPARKLQVY